MLREIEETRQIHDEPHRRWFAGKGCDLLVWMTEQGMMWGFELRYPRRGAVEPDALLRWDCEGGAVHHLVDSGGEGANGYKMTPLYGPAVSCDLDRLVEVYGKEIEADSDPILRDISSILRETRRRGIFPLA